MPISHLMVNVHVCVYMLDQQREESHYRPEASEKDGRKIISDRLEFYDYYRPSLNNQKVTVAHRWLGIKFLISLTASIASCFSFSFKIVSCEIK